MSIIGRHYSLLCLLIITFLHIEVYCCVDIYISLQTNQKLHNITECVLSVRRQWTVLIVITKPEGDYTTASVLVQH